MSMTVHESALAWVLFLHYLIRYQIIYSMQIELSDRQASDNVMGKANLFVSE